MIRRANEFRKAGDDQAALPLLEQAYAVAHSARAAAQLGLCKQALGSWPDAEVYLSESLHADSDPWVRKYRHTLEESLLAAKSHIGRLEITGQPRDAEVLVDGNSVGHLPLSAPVRVSAGEIQVELRAPGFVRGGRAVRVEGGQYQKVAIQLDREAEVRSGGGPPLPATTAAIGQSSAGNEARVDLASEPAAAPAPRWRPVAKWSAFGAAVVGLGLGTYGALRNHSLVGDFDGGCWIDNGTVKTDGGSRTLADCSNLKSRYESAATLGIVGFASAAALAATGAILWLTDPDRRRDSPPAVACAGQLAPDVGGQGGAGFGFAFGCSLRL